MLKLEAFLELLRRSGLVTSEQLTRLVAAAKDDKGPGLADDCRPVADQLIADGVITRWQCEKLMEGRHKGFFLGKYKLLDHLGTGGMSSVYLADHVLMHRRVAIKVLPQNRITDSSYLARFYREAQASAALDHPNIVRAYDIDNDGNIHYIVMEYIEGSDLQATVKQQGRQPVKRAAWYIRQAAAALAHAHTAGIVHRDVKPANLLVDVKGNVKVLDMGLARFGKEPSTSLTLAHNENVLGTADYLSPEQALDSHDVDNRADIYSLGCTFYFLLAGQPPFPDGTLAQRLLKHQTEEPLPIRSTRSDCPQDLEEICHRMMAKKPDERFQSADEIVGAIDQWLRDQGTGKEDRPRAATKRLAAGGADSSIIRSVAEIGESPAVAAQVGEAGTTTQPTAPPETVAKTAGSTLKAVVARGVPSAPGAGGRGSSKKSRGPGSQTPRTKSRQGAVGVYGVREEATPPPSDDRPGGATTAPAATVRQISNELPLDRLPAVPSGSVLLQGNPLARRPRPSAKQGGSFSIPWIWLVVGASALVATSILATVLYSLFTS